MTMKRKLLTVVSVVLILGLAAMGILAYLTDRDSAANVFTVGDVKIELTEEFDEENAILTPGVNIEKDVKIKNVGKNDAWVWTTIAIPSALDNDDASKNVLHFNFSKESVAEGQWTWMDGEEWAVKKDVDIKDDGVLYNVYTVKYQTALKPGDTTAASAMYKVYLDKQVDIDPEGNWYKVSNGEVTPIDWNSEEDGDPIMYVSAYAIQKENFDNVHDAYDAFQVQWGLKDAAADDGNADTTAPAISIVKVNVYTQKITITDVEDSDYPLTVEVYARTENDIEKSLDSTIEISKNGDNISYEEIGFTDNQRILGCSLENGNIVTTYNMAPEQETTIIAKVKNCSGVSSEESSITIGAAVGCFVAGTKIQTVDGLVNIEDVHVGDKVYSINLLTGKKVVNIVSWVQERRYNDETYTIYAGKEKIATTYEHPFYVEGKGWVAAEKLEAGNKLRIMDGTNIVIDKIVRTQLAVPVQVYNFTVEDSHNYLITETGILVHNVQK